jgi:Flp pilus assembly protein TadB
VTPASIYPSMTVALVAVIAPDLLMAATVVVALAAVIVVGLLAVMLERRRRNRRFAKKLSPYVRRRMPGDGQVLDPNDRPGR